MKRFFLLVLLILTLIPNHAFAESFAEKKGPKGLIFLGGDVLSLSMKMGTVNGLRILSGQAEGLPQNTLSPRGVHGFDVYSRSFSAQIKGTPSLTLSGPRRVRLSGISISRWGTVENPAIFIDRDTHLELLGAVTDLVILINPLARVTFDFRKLHVKERITLVNGDPNWMIVKGIPPYKVSYKKWTPPAVVVTSAEGWGEAPTEGDPKDAAVVLEKKD